MQGNNRFDWIQTIKPNLFMLKILGLWPPEGETYGYTLYTAYEVFNVLFLQIGIIFCQTTNVVLHLNDIDVVTKTIFALIMEIMAPLKSYSTIKNMGSLKQLLTTVNSDLFQPKNPRQRSLIQPNLNAWKTTVGTFWFFSIGWLFSTMLYPVFDDTVEYSLPFLAWYPYDIKISPRYELTYLHQVVTIGIITVTHITIDSLIASLNMYIGAQFDILCDDLRHFCDSTENSPENVSDKLKHCIHHHREILKFAENANQFYNWLIFEEFFAGAIAIGLSMFQLTVVVPFTSEFHSHVAYTNGISVQVFMYCWFGNEIEVKSSKLTYAIFESDWTGLPLETQKELIIFLIRVQTPLKMSAFGLFYLSLETFVKILRTAWSYFALLRQINSSKSL